MSQMSPTTASPRWHVLAAFASVYVFWGGTYLGIRFALESLPPFLMAGARFLTAGTILYVWMRAKGAPRPSRIHWRDTAIIGGLLLLGGNGGVTWAEQHVPSSLAALVVGAMPLWIALLGWLFFGSGRPTSRLSLGLITGFVGIALLVGPDNLTGEGGSLAGIGALLFAALSWAFGSLYALRATLPRTPLQVTGMEMICGGALLAALGTLSGEWGDVHLAEISLKSGVAFGYLVIGGSLLGFSAYVWLLQNVPPAQAATYAYVNPVVALFLGWALADEPVTALTLIAAAIIIGSVVLITTAKVRPAPVEPEPTPVLSEPVPSPSGAGK
ncbi:MAG TPA: EamA family transporter [Aggregatilinea sp.]|uniref:EamA family transporter n=1 Tax=Aggregatilinea sp. TaxID=2806333 RepID=UPI002CC06757|nr:EamA family transporter [Aggregatilinea sp.]HML21516.1 EamA family transporter [Aggregatilinea sp.]